MKKQHYFISGLPRSGSTLLSAILQQNPLFHAGISDSLLTHFRTQIECANSTPLVDTKRLQNILLSTVDAYYYDIDKPVIFNTNRLWTNLIPELKALYPYTKIICCVRSIPKIIDSFERMHQSNPFTISTVYGKDNDMNVYTRAASLMSNNSIVRLPYDSLKSAISGRFSSELLLVEYDLFTTNPKGVMKAIYSFINQPYFEHDFSNVNISFDEYDNTIGMRGLHTTKRVVQPDTKHYTIPPDIIAQYSNLEVWRE